MLFINASEHFEKGKRQNQLSKSHIDKIVETYQKREKETRDKEGRLYSKRVSLKTIEKEHDFNLNISRYVSTAQVEQEIDLGKIHDHLLEINDRAEKARKIHNGFLKELGLKQI